MAKTRLETNLRILNGELNKLTLTICKSVTISGTPIRITGNDPYTITSPPPNPQAGILNPRFLATTSIKQTIEANRAKYQRLLKSSKTVVKEFGLGGGTQAGGSIDKVINSLRLERDKVLEGRSDGSKLNEVLYADVIKAIAGDLLKKQLHTQFKLTPSTLTVLANQILPLCEYAPETYGSKEYHKLIIISVLKVINF